MDPRIRPLERLVQIIDRLRAEDGCPWDREQTIASMVPCAQEEAAEVADAVASGDVNAICEEVGDLLMNVFLISRIAEQDGSFSLQDVASQISDKLIRRHPHVFGDTRANDAREALQSWERVKAKENADRRDGKARSSRMDGIPTEFSALSRARKMVSRAAAVGFDWPDARGALDKVREETAELEDALKEGPLRQEEELGDLLFACVCTARLMGHDPDLALRKACGRFERRFRFVEDKLADRLEDASLDEMEQAWQEAKVAGH